MTEAPATRRRWFQFRISTILVLVTICAWVMAMRPWARFDWVTAPRTVSPLSEELWGGSCSFDVGERGLICGLHGHSRHNYYGLHIGITPPAIVWPVFALVAFLAWKWTWLRVVWWREARRTRVGGVDRVGVSAGEATKARPRWLRVGLRSIGVFLAFAAMALALWAWQARRHKRELGAVAAIQNEQGWAVVRWVQPAPDWVVSLLGDDLSEVLRTVEEVSFPRAPADSRAGERPGTRHGLVDDELSPLMLHLAALPNLETLQLNGTNITDESLERLDRLVSLKCVHLRGTRVTDDGIAALKGKLPKLRIED